MDHLKTYKGIFWIPTEQDNSKNGLLKFLDKTAYVDLFDSFDKAPFNIGTKRRDEICCIHGILENGRCCILSNCKLSIGNPLGGVISTLINFTHLFYSSNRDLVTKSIQFKKIEFNLNTLFHWGGENSIEKNNDYSDQLSLNYKRPKVNEVIYEDANYTLKLNHTTSIPGTTNKKNLLIEQDTSFVLRLNGDDEDISNTLNFINKIHDLFIIFHSDKVDLSNTLHLTTSENEGFYYCYNNKVRFRKSRRYQSHESGNLFTFDELKRLTNVNDLFKQWIHQYDSHDYTIKLLISSLSDVGMNSQHKFMNLVYGFEHLSSKDLNVDLAQKFHNKKEKEILEKIDKLIIKETQVQHKNFFDKLKSRLEKNRKLSDKFKAFFEQQEIPTLELFKEESAAFIEKVVNTRNHFAHVSDTEPRIKQDELHLYNFKLEAVLLFIFFKKMEIQSDKILIKLRMHDRYQRITN